MQIYGAQPTKTRFWRGLKKFDLFPKAAEEVKDKSSAGGLITILGAILIVFLLVGETQDYLTPQTKHSVWVDTELGGQMMIYFDFIINALKCDEIQLDLVDESGGHKPVTGISYRPVDGSKEWEGTYWYATTFGRRGFFAGEPETMTGCNVAGQILADKTKGNLHIAAGASMTQGHSDHSHHVHRLQPKDVLATYNVTHKINWINFGPTYPGKASPLAFSKFLHTDKTNYQINYIIKLVPTVYEEANGDQKTSFQYSVSEHRSIVDYSRPNFPLPGIFFKWDISAYMIRQSENTGNTFARFLIRVCAVLGGSFVVLGLILRTLNRAYNAVKDKES